MAAGARLEAMRRRVRLSRLSVSAADPAGYAQLFLNAWLRSSTDYLTTAQARLA